MTYCQYVRYGRIPAVSGESSTECTSYSLLTHTYYVRVIRYPLAYSTRRTLLGRDATCMRPRTDHAFTWSSFSERMQLALALVQYLSAQSRSQLKLSRLLGKHLAAVSQAEAE